MSKATLTAASIESFPAPDAGKQKIYWDAKLPGFGVSVTTGARTFVCESRVKGKTRRVSLAPVGTLSVAEARKQAQKQLGQMATDVDPNAAKAKAKAKSLTVGQAIDAYLSDRLLKASTAKHYRDVTGWYLSDWHKRQIKDITPAAVVQRFDKITKDHGAPTANLAFRYFRAIYNHAIALTKANDGTVTLPANPVARLSDLKRWHKPTRRKDHITDFPAFFAAVDTAADVQSNRYQNAGADFADFAELLIRTGLRKAEAANLTWADVDMNAKTLRITAERAKNHEELILPMAAQVVAIMERLQERYAGTTYVWGRAPLGDPRKTLQRAREAYGEPFGFHDLRRTYAILAEKAGTPFSMLKRLLNHSTGQDVTLGHYLTSEDPEPLREYVQRVNDAIDELAGVQH